MNRALLGLVVFALCGAAAGFWSLNRYAMTPGQSGGASNWPPNAALCRENGRTTVVIALHPECSCSEASIAELRAAMVRMPQAPRLIFLFADYGIPDAPVQQSALWRMAREFAGAQVLADRQAAVAKSFGALTSGEVRVFDGNGRLVFAGGTTGARGHPGESPARAALIKAVNSPSTVVHMPVFGCSLESPSSERPFSK